MKFILMIIVCLSAVVAYVLWCLRRDRRAGLEHQAVIMAMSSGPKIRELTTVRPNPNPPRMRRFASGSRSAFSAAPADDFGHVSTDYGTYTPAEMDTSPHQHHAATCVEVPVHDTGHHVSHHDVCSVVDTPYGGFDSSSHHGD